MCSAHPAARVGLDVFVLQDSDFFKLFDVDGDGLVSFYEYLMLVTFLSIPPEV